jgi:hypothetical protein
MNTAPDAGSQQMAVKSERLDNISLESLLLTLATLFSIPTDSCCSWRLLVSPLKGSAGLCPIGNFAIFSKLYSEKTKTKMVLTSN